MYKKNLILRNNLLNQQGIIKYCKHFLKIAERPVKQAKHCLKEAENNPKMVIDNPVDEKVDFDDNISHDLGDTYIKGNFDVSKLKPWFVKQITKEHNYLYNPANFIGAAKVINTCKKRIPKCNKVIQDFLNLHKSMKTASFKILLKHNYLSGYHFDANLGTPMDMTDVFSNVARKTLNALKESKVESRQQLGKMLDHKLHYVSCLLVAKGLAKKNPKVIFDKYKFEQDIHLDTWSKVLHPWSTDEADYQFLVANGII